MIRERHKRSKKKLKIKNWLLLAARMLLLALMALALARPTLNSETSLGDQEVPTALALVFDTSMSMQYTERGKRPAGRGQAPGGRDPQEDRPMTARSSCSTRPTRSSRWPSRRPRPASGSTRSALRAANRPLNAAVVQASKAVAESNLARREVYVLTDLASSAWELGSTRTTEELEKIREAKKVVRTYVLKLTPKDVRDVAILAAEPTSAIVTEGEPVEIKATLRSSGPATERVAEFWLDGDNKKDQKLVDLPANGEVEVTFITPSKLEPGLHQGRIKLGGGTDNMAFDDVRYFTFNTQPALRILLVSDLNIDALFVEKALAPEAVDRPGRRRRHRSRSSARPASSSRLGARLSLKDYAAVFLLNVDGLTAADWGKLALYVREGGGLVVAPGDRADASILRPGRLIDPAGDARWRRKPLPRATPSAGPTSTTPSSIAIPRLLDPELTAWPVYRYWTVKPADSSRTILQLRRRRPGRPGAELQRDPDRPRPALDDPALPRRVSPRRPGGLE